MVEDSEKSQQPSWFLNIIEQMNEITECYGEKLKRCQQQREAHKKKIEVETKLAQERKAKVELTEQISELNRRITELTRVCATPLAIGENDQKRLDNAKELFELGKELTGIRWDFSAPPNVCKGYIKSKTQMLLQPFEVPEGDSEALWNILESTAAPIWSDKENLPDNFRRIQLKDE